MVRAPLRVLPRSLAPSGVLGGGRSGPGSPLLGLGLWGWRQCVPGGGPIYRCVGRLGSCAPPPPTARPLDGLSGSAIHVLWARACGCGGPALSLWGLHAAGRVCGVHMLGGGTGGGACAVPPSCAAGAGPVGQGVALPHGAAPHTTPVRAHPASLGTICAASRCAGVNSLVLRGPYGSRRLGRGGGSHSGSSLRRGGTLPPASGGGGRGPRGLRAGWGAGGGVSRRGLPALLPGGGLRYSILPPPVSPARSLPACACGRG